jgi:hypothetical protein
MYTCNFVYKLTRRPLGTELEWRPGGAVKHCSDIVATIPHCFIWYFGIFVGAAAPTTHNMAPLL